MSRSRRSPERGSMSGPHGFVEPPDPRLGLALGAGQSAGRGGPGSSIGSALIAGVSTWPVRCALTGCGKEREDPIHWPAE